jgi:hypothetical protein
MGFHVNRFRDGLQKKASQGAAAWWTEDMSVEMTMLKKASVRRLSPVRATCRAVTVFGSSVVGRIFHSCCPGCRSY